MKRLGACHHAGSGSTSALGSRKVSRTAARPPGGCKCTTDTRGLSKGNHQHSSHVHPSAAVPRARLLEDDPLLLEEDEEEEEDEVPSRSQPRAAMSSATAARSGRWRRSASSHRALIFGRLHSGGLSEGYCEGSRVQHGFAVLA